MSKYPFVHFGAYSTPPLDMGPEALPAGARYGAQRAGGVMHWGVDIAQSPGDPIVAPETMQIVKVGVGAGTAVKLDAPLDGYGPGAVVALGQSGVFHLLAHLDPAWWESTENATPTVGRIYVEGERIGAAPAKVGNAGSHVHWEVRLHDPYDSPATRAANTVDPLQWARSLPHGFSPSAFGDGGTDNPTPGDPALAAAIAAKQAAGPTTAKRSPWVAVAAIAAGLLIFTSGDKRRRRRR